MMNYSMVYAQDLVKNSKDTIEPKIDLMVINGDTLFTMNRKFAEQIAIEHDSLEIVTAKLKECNDVLNSSLEVKDQYKTALEQSQGVSDMLKKELYTKDKIINSYKKIDESQQAIQSELTKQFNKMKNRNKWLTGLSIGGVSVGFTSIILLLLK
jgi:hypothetical protein